MVMSGLAALKLSTILFISVLKLSSPSAKTKLSSVGAETTLSAAASVEAAAEVLSAGAVLSAAEDAEEPQPASITAVIPAAIAADNAFFMVFSPFRLLVFFIGGVAPFVVYIVQDGKR